MLEVTERGEPLRFSFDDVLRYIARAECDAAQEARLTELKRALAGRVLARAAAEVVELSPR